MFKTAVSLTSSVSRKFVPLEWDERGNGVNALVKNLRRFPTTVPVVSGISTARQTAQSNPLKFGLPGGRYAETALVNLSAAKTEPEASSP